MRGMSRQLSLNVRSFCDFVDGFESCGTEKVRPVGIRVFMNLPVRYIENHCPSVAVWLWLFVSSRNEDSFLLIIIKISFTPLYTRLLFILVLQ